MCRAPQAPSILDPTPLTVAVVLLFTIMLTFGCSSAIQPGDGGTKGEIVELQQRVLELQRKAAVQEVEMARLRQQMADIEVRKASAEPPPPQEAEEQPAIVANPVSVRPLGNIEQVDLPPDDEASGDETARVVSVSPTAGTAEAISEDAQRLYDKGYTLYHQARYVDSEEVFRDFVERHPTSDLADNAQYWIGECRFANKDLRGALSAFQETVNRHPNGNKVPDALLKTGQVLEDLGDVSSARQSYRELQRRFPDSAAAVVASERLERL
jgi:tol-pal system protein YbgF